VAFSTHWEQIYRQGKQNSVWPWTDLVSYVMRYARPEQRPYRVLELGFGAGANIPFFLDIGAEYSGIEGSAAAVERVRRRFAGADNLSLAWGDFTETIPFAGPFDLIVDRSSLTHNGTAAIRSCLRQQRGLLRSGGKFIGIDWFSTAHTEFPSGRELEDRYTRGGFQAGQFCGVGTVHFADEAHLQNLLVGAGFEIQLMEHKQVETVFPATPRRMAWWNFVAVKT
jgi:SAM-dependent methyltransferase